MRGRSLSPLWSLIRSRRSAGAEERVPTVDDFLRLKDIHKSFVGVYALKGVDFSVRSGEVHCLIGENGSGKSTLIKIISGVEQPDSGELWVGGTHIPRAIASDMIHRGIQVIYQDLSLLPNLTVAENVAIAQLAKSGRPLISWREIRQIARAATARIRVKLDLGAIAGELPVGLQQMVAICRAMTGDLRLLMLDEPTASLTKGEIDNLFAVVRDMQAHGISILFISHKLNEVLDIADRVTVLRDGRTVGTLPRDQLSNDRLVEMMTGKAVTQTRFRYKGGQANKLLEVRNLSKRYNFADISFDLYAGEILGIAGLIGSGRTELALALFGISPADSGSITVEGTRRRITSVQDAVAAGFAYVPENRLVQGLVLKHSVAANLIAAVIGRLVGRWGMIDEPRRDGLVSRWLKALDIRVAHPDVAVQTLSGGNQQRVVIGKCLATEPKILILDGPTVGIDIAAKSSIHQIVRDLAARGTGVILISDEVPEVVANSNRLLLMRAGRIGSEIDDETVIPERVQALVEAAR
jgi:simple sugar transport system ATP-binding protein